MYRIREYRLACGLTAKQLATALHLSESSVTMYETGKRMPSPDILSKMADIFGTTVDELLGRIVWQSSSKEVLVSSEKQSCNRLQHLRKERGFTQSDVGNAIGVSAQAYGHYETGKRGIDMDVLIRLSEFFGVSTDYILGISDTQVPQNNELTEPERTLLHLLSQISSEKREKVIAYIEAFLRLVVDN